VTEQSGNAVDHPRTGRTPLLIGIDSTIGRSMAAYLSTTASPFHATTRRPQGASTRCSFLDLRYDLTSWRPPPGTGPVYICAAISQIDACERDPTESAQVNTEGPITIARRCAESGAFVVFLSTSQVFDGATPRCRPEDSPSPLTTYGRQKALAEAGIGALGSQSAIVRLTKVLPPDSGLLGGWIDALQAGDVIRPFSDLVFAPVTIDFAVGILLHIGERRLPGIFHASATHDISYEQAALHLCRRIGADEGLIEPSLAAEVRPEMVRQEHSSLDPSSLQKLGFEAPSPWVAVESTLT
jgi:dTDP-4-dehydrorhamnose reductase